MTTTMSLWDIGIILFYFAIILWIAQWASKGNKEGSAADYFLAGKNQGGWLWGHPYSLLTLAQRSF